MWIVQASWKVVWLQYNHGSKSEKLGEVIILIQHLKNIWGIQYRIKYTLNFN